MRAFVQLVFDDFILRTIDGNTCAGTHIKLPSDVKVTKSSRKLPTRYGVTGLHEEQRCVSATMGPSGGRQLAFVERFTRYMYNHMEDVKV